MAFSQSVAVIPTASVWQRQMISPLFLAFDAADGTVRGALVGRSIVQYPNDKLLLFGENSNALNALATRPKPEVVETVADQIGPTDRCGEPQKPHLDASSRTGPGPKRPAPPRRNMTRAALSLAPGYNSPSTTTVCNGHAIA
jgi:hypothetical protein